MSRILGIDTATWTASVAVVADDRLLAERALPSAPSHGFSLVPLIQDVLAEGGVRVEDLDAVAVSIGPGSFTGLRIGLSTAKGIAFARGLSLVGVSTLRALALAAAVPNGLVCPVLDARKGEVYTALFRAAAGTLDIVVEERAVVLDDWLRRIDGPCTFIGDAAPLMPGPKARPDGWRVLPFEEFHPEGRIVASLGWQRLAAGEADDLATLEPSYLRPSEAELKAARQ